MHAGLLQLLRMQSFFCTNQNHSVVVHYQYCEWVWYSGCGCHYRYCASFETCRSVRIFSIAMKYYVLGLGLMLTSYQAEVTTLQEECIAAKMRVQEILLCGILGVIYWVWVWYTGCGCGILGVGGCGILGVGVTLGIVHPCRLWGGAPHNSRGGGKEKGIWSKNGTQRHVKGHSLMHRWLTIVKSPLSIAHAGKGGLQAGDDGPQGGLHKAWEGGERGEGSPHGCTAA